MNKPHTLICVIGKTAAGKDELVNRLCTTTKAKQLISYTTRLKRNGEGNTHIFVDETKYFDMLDAGSVAVDTNIAETTIGQPLTNYMNLTYILLIILVTKN